jgi:hypothetical protein
LKKKKKKSRIRKIQQSLRSLVCREVIAKFWREHIDSHALTGYVVGLGSDFVAIQVQSNEITLNGYTVLRVKDITLIEEKPEWCDFYVEALKLRGYTPSRPVGICLDGVVSVLESINRNYPLLTVHREGIIRDECAIGRVENLTAKTLILQWLTPGAKWDGYSPRYKLKTITKIDFGDLYADALARVAQIQPDESGHFG